jgi:hypothetical protein
MGVCVTPFFLVLLFVKLFPRAYATLVGFRKCVLHHFSNSESLIDKGCAVYSSTMTRLGSSPCILQRVTYVVGAGRAHGTSSLLQDPFRRLRISERFRLRVSAEMRHGCTGLAKIVAKNHTDVIILFLLQLSFAVQLII